MKSLFNKNESYNEAGGKVNSEISEALCPVIEKWAGKNYKIKDIESIVIDVIGMQSTIMRAKRLLSSPT